MKRVEFRAGSDIINQGEEGHTAFLIVSGSVLVRTGLDGQASALRTLGPGEVFGEMCLIEPGRRSASVKAITDTECIVTAYDEFLPAMHKDPERALVFMKSLVRRIREVNNLISVAPIGSQGQAIQQGLQVILAGLEGRDVVQGEDLATLNHDLRNLLQIDREQPEVCAAGKSEGAFVRDVQHELLQLCVRAAARRGVRDYRSVTVGQIDAHESFRLG